MAVWILSGEDNIVKILADGRIHDAAPLDIWAAEFEDLTTVNGFHVRRPSDDIHSVEFSQVFPDLKLHIFGDYIGNIQLSIVACDGDILADVTPESLAAGQLVLNGVWYCIDMVLISELQDLLLERDIRLHSKVNIGQFVWLQSCKSIIVPVIVSESCDSALKVFAQDSSDEILNEGVNLYPYQRKGFTFLSSIADEGLGCILADEMGLGKTLQVIALLSREAESCRGQNLVVCPATLLENWSREFQKFAPHLRVYIHQGPHRTGDWRFFQRFNVVVASYETVVRDEPQLSSLTWGVIVLDEAQNIKNPEAQRTLAVKSLPRRVSIAVTGTPVENRLTDLWSLADYALPGLLGTRKDFEVMYGESCEDASKLAQVIRPIILRRRLADVASELPPRIDVMQPLTMTSEMAIAYDDVRLSTINDYAQNASLVVIGKLRQFCAHHLLCRDFLDFDFVAPKIQRLKEILDEVFSCGQKALLFTSYLRMADFLLAFIKNAFCGAWIGSIDGRLPVPERQGLVDTFSSHVGAGCLVLNPKAAGVGLNIVAANHVIHYNPEWNPALQDQSSARAHRLGQTQPVTVHHLYYVDTVEDLMIQRLDFKRSLAQEAAVGHAGEYGSLDVAKALQISPHVRRGTV